MKESFYFASNRHSFSFNTLREEEIISRYNFVVNKQGNIIEIPNELKSIKRKDSSYITFIGMDSFLFRIQGDKFESLKGVNEMKYVPFSTLELAIQYTKLLHKERIELTQKAKKDLIQSTKKLKDIESNLDVYKNSHPELFI